MSVEIDSTSQLPPSTIKPIVQPQVDSTTPLPPGVKPLPTFTIFSENPPPEIPLEPDWTNDLLWDTPVIFEDVGGTATFTPDGVVSNTFDGQTHNDTNPVPPHSNTNIESFAEITYSGPEVNCKVSGHLLSTLIGAGSSPGVLLAIIYDFGGANNTLAEINFSNEAHDEDYELPFTIPETAIPTLIRVVVQITAAAVPDETTCNLTGTFENLATP